MMKLFLIVAFAASALAVYPTGRNPDLPTEDPLCPNGDGDFHWADPACNWQYISCSGGVHTVRNCSTMDLAFDEATGRCEDPAYVAVCDGNPTPARPATTTVPDPIQISCEGREVGDKLYASHYEKCNDFYFVCLGGPYAVRRLCAEGTVFDTELLVCDFFDNVPNCSGSPRPTTTTTEASVTEPTPTIDYPCEVSGDFPHPGYACNRFFVVCDASLKSHLMKCPPNTFYDRVYKQCLFFNQVPDCSGTPHPPTTTTIQGPEESTTAVPFDCTGLADGNYPPPDTKCPSYFYSCSGNIAYRTECPGDNLRYDEYEDACLEQEDNAACQPEGPCTDRNNGFYPDPEGACDKFLFCTNGHSFRVMCKEGFVYNDAHKRCQPIDTVPAPCGTHVPFAPFSCATADGLFRSKNSCRAYFKCYKGGLSAFTCKDMEAFDEASGECKPATEVEGCHPPMSVDLRAFCSVKGRDGIFSHPSHRCERAIVCIGYNPFVFNCGETSLPYYSHATRQCEAVVEGCGGVY